MQERKSRKERVRKVAVIASVATVAFGVVGGASFADGGKSASKSQYGNQYKDVKRMAICHKGRTIVVSGRSVPGHLRHGDVVGPCAVALKKHHGKSGDDHGKKGESHGKSGGEHGNGHH